MNCSRSSKHSYRDEFVGLRNHEPYISQTSESINSIILQEEDEVTGYECIFCDKVFDAFERLEEHQEYHLIESEYTEKAEADVSNIPVPKICNMFPEITSLLTGKAPTKEDGEIDRNTSTQSKQLESQLSEACEVTSNHKQFKTKPESQGKSCNVSEELEVEGENMCGKRNFIENRDTMLERGTALIDLRSTEFEIKDHPLDANVTKDASSVVAEGRNVTIEKQTNATNVDPELIEMESHANIASNGEDLEIVYVTSSDNKDPEKLDSIIDESISRKEADYNVGTSNFDANADSVSVEKGHHVVDIVLGKSANSVHALDFRSEPATTSYLSDCMIVKPGIDETGSDTTGQLQKQDFQLCCQICKKHFANLSGQEKLHFMDRPLLCNVCSIALKKDNLMISHHSISKEERPFTCETCGKAFKRSDTLAIHQRTHLGIRPHTCEVCLKSYVSKFVLKRHQVVHSGERPFACDMCDRNFRLKYDLTVHKRRHFDDKPFPCKECGKKFTNSGHVATHMLIHKNQRSFICCECSKSFLRKEHLERHFSNVHVGERKHVCDICKKRFKRPEVLKTHLLTHSGKGDFACKHCGKTYTKKWNLQAHMVRHEKS